MSLSHDALAMSLAGHLRTDRRMTWCDVQLGQAGSPRPDVYTLDKSFVSPCPTVYECKVSRADFLADATAGKWQSYLKFAGAVWFACEGELIRKTEVPEMCGLIRLVGGQWRAAKRPIVQTVEVPQAAWLKLVMDGVEREGPKYRLRHHDVYLTLEAAKKIRKRFGDDVAVAVTSLENARMSAENAQRQADYVVSQAEKRARDRVQEIEKVLPARWSQVCQLLGLKADASDREIGWAIDRITREREDRAERVKLHIPAVRLQRHIDELESLARVLKSQIQPEEVPA